jgi:putative Mg2+ transporter-C (MgtC) family protein
MPSSLLNIYVWLDYLVKLTVAMVLSGVVGLERQWRRKPAGLRTHMLVCLGSLIFTLLGFDLLAREGTASLRVDPLRIVEAIVGGLGFLGAGAIIQARGSVQGLTTATSIWTMGALGVAVGIGNYPIAILTTLFSILVLSIVDRFEKRFLRAESSGKGSGGPLADEE